MGAHSRPVEPSLPSHATPGESVRERAHMCSRVPLVCTCVWGDPCADAPNLPLILLSE